MMKKSNFKKIIGLFIILVLSFQFLLAQDYSFHPKYYTILELNKGKELMKQCSRCTPKNIMNFWNVSESDMTILETNFNKVMKLKSVCGTTYTNESISGLKQYLFQYIGVTIGSQKFIYVNAFVSRDTRDLWETEPVNVCDGGKGFWGVLFNLESLEFIELSFNDAG